MSGSINATAPVRQPTWRRLPHRLQSARVILFGWLVFTMVGFIQPCCSTLANADEIDQHVSGNVVSGDDVLHTAGTEHGNDDCPQLATPDVITVGQPLMLAATVDQTDVPVIVADAPSMPAVSMLPGAFIQYALPPPPGAFHVRTRRLLI